MRTIERGEPDARHPAIGFLIDDGDRVGDPFSVGRDLRVPGLLEGEVIFGGDSAALSQCQGCGEGEKHKDAAHIWL